MHRVQRIFSGSGRRGALGKDNDGVVWISIIDKNKDRPRIKFFFGEDNFHRFIHGDGTPYTNAETSVLYAQGYVTMLQQMMGHLLCTLWVEPEKKPDNRNGGGGYNRNNNNGGGNRNSGGGSNSSSDADDDIPF